MNSNSKQFILIADDDAEDRESIKEALVANNCRHEFIMMENGEELIKYLHNIKESEYPTLILLDLNMPVKGGKEALKEIKQNKLLAHIPVVVFTTSSSDKERNDMYRLGANCFITKSHSHAEQIDIAASLVKLWLT